MCCMNQGMYCGMQEENMGCNKHQQMDNCCPKKDNCCSCHPKMDNCCPKKDNCHTNCCNNW